LFFQNSSTCLPVSDKFKVLYSLYFNVLRLIFRGGKNTEIIVKFQEWVGDKNWRFRDIYIKSSLLYLM